MVRGALSAVLISGSGGKVTFARPVVRTRFGTAGGALTDCHFFLQLNAMFERAFARVGRFWAGVEGKLAIGGIFRDDPKRGAAAEQEVQCNDGNEDWRRVAA